MVNRPPAGTFRHQIKIQSYSTALDSYGQASTTGTWTTDYTRRASIEPLQGNEATLARQVYPQATYKITTEYVKALDSTGGCLNRILFGSRVFQIGAILNPGEEEFYHEMYVSEEK